MSFRVCGDNLDKTVKRRYMCSDKENLLLHCFHCYAVIDHITTSFSDSLPPTHMKFFTLVSKMLCNGIYCINFVLKFRRSQMWYRYIIVIVKAFIYECISLSCPSWCTIQRIKQKGSHGRYYGSPPLMCSYFGSYSMYVAHHQSTSLVLVSNFTVS